MYSVYVTRKLPGQGLDRLRSLCNVTIFPEDRNITKAELLGVIAQQDAVITMLADPIDAEVIAAGEKLKVIANYAVGFNNIDTAAASARGIAVVNTPDVLTDASADFAWALLLATARRAIEGDSLVRRGGFVGWAPELLVGVEVHGKTLGIVGAGRIGQAVARRALGFNMRTLYHNRSRLPDHVEKELNLTYADLGTLLKEADFVSLHCPLTPETRHLIGAAELRLMKPTAVLINTARGPVVDEAALVQALRERTIYGAGLDVYEAEPALHPGLAELSNVVLAPHIASAGMETRLKMVDLVVNDVLAVLQGERPRNLVNPQIF
ncbi:MAG TPA: D-glycerate dehydrogenase [Firmicutes bacterium]|jgi:glyoxylate reductase|nr:D-glycerate dehydrogenase [Bacillota bacterium]HHT43447.1 D-glycerate dehydrogenase [Bacillota bacterium]